MSDKAELVIRSTGDLRRLSKDWRKQLLYDGDQRSKCRTLSALKDSFNRMRKSCALMSASLFTALASSSHRFDQAESKAAPGKSGAPRSSASAAGTIIEAKTRAQGV